MAETQYEALRRQGVSRRSFLQFCSLTAASLGLGSAGAKDIATAMQTKPRVPVVWLHGLECTCCTESFIRSYHPIAKDIVLSMVSLDYDDTIMAAAGEQAEAALEDTITKYKGQSSSFSGCQPRSAFWDPCGRNRHMPGRNPSPSGPSSRA